MLATGIGISRIFRVLELVLISFDRKDSEGNPIQHFDEACAALLREVVLASGIISKEDTEDARRGSLGILDVGFGCGDQTWELARLALSSGWTKLRYVGLTLDGAQVQAAQRKVYREVARSEVADMSVGWFRLFRANAANPELWSPPVKQAVSSLADCDVTDRWFLALDCLYHFSPSRKPVLKHAAQKIGANFMAFDMLLNETASKWNTLLLRLVGVFMGCPFGTFLTEQQYRDELAECGFDKESISIREITPRVFPGLVDYLDEQDRALGEYGISLGGFKLAQRLFQWFSHSHVVKAIVVIAHVEQEPC
jgi:hypothetical protein